MGLDLGPGLWSAAGQPASAGVRWSGGAAIRPAPRLALGEAPVLRAPPPESGCLRQRALSKTMPASARPLRGFPGVAPRGSTAAADSAQFPGPPPLSGDGPAARVWQYFLAREAQLRKDRTCCGFCPMSGAVNPCLG